MISSIRQFFQEKLFRIKPLIKNCLIVQPDNLWVSSQKDAKPTLLPMSKIESLLGISWTENILGTASNNKKYLQSFEKIYSTENLPDVSAEELRDRTKEISEKCAIRWLDHPLGWVLVLRAGQTLEKGFLCMYTGLVTINKLHSQSSYLAREFFLSLFKTENEDIGIDAKQYGNVSRFLPFLLERDYLKNFEIDIRIKDQIAVANLIFQKALLNDVVVPCVYIPETITAAPNQEVLLGVNYSLEYLTKMQDFKLIDKDQFTPLDSKFYSLKQVQIQLEGLSYSFTLSRLRLMAAKNFPDLKFRTIGFDEEKKEYYEITVSDADLYRAAMEFPEATSLTIKPEIKLISYDRFLQIKQQK